MAGFASVLRYVAFTLMALFGLLGGLFVAGYAFEDPGGRAALGMTALWVVPVVALCVFALRRPTAAGTVLVGVTATVAAFTLLDSFVGVIPRDDLGPVAAIVVFALGVVLAFLGLHRAALAGLLMVAISLAQLGATTMLVIVGAGGTGEGPGTGAMLTTSSGVVVVPLLVVGALFLVAGAMAHESPLPRRTHRMRAAPTAPGQAESLCSETFDRPASSLATGTRKGEQET
ncbi:MAG: hypothetical protein ACRDOW_05060 [Nocardioidaceae bacterium]